MTRALGGNGGDPDRLEIVGFGEFVETRSRTLLRAAWLLTGDWHAAEDLVQTSLAASWPRCSTLVRTDAPELYVQRVMLTTYLKWTKRRWNGELATGTVPELTSVDDDFDAADLRESLKSALERLSTKQGAVIVLRFFLDLTESQTADVLGCSTGAVKTHASRGLSTLRGTPGLADVMTGGAVS